MEYEISDDPQGIDGTPDTEEYREEEKVVERHRALQNQSSVEAKDYPRKDRKAQSLVD